MKPLIWEGRRWADGGMMTPQAFMMQKVLMAWHWSLSKIWFNCCTAQIPVLVGTSLHHCWPFLQVGKTAGQQSPGCACSQAKGHLLCPYAALLGPPEGKGSFSSRSGPKNSFWAQSQKQLPCEACWQRLRRQTPLLHSYNCCCCWNTTLVLNQLQWNRRLWENKLLPNISLTSFPLVALLLSGLGFMGHFVF